MTLLFFIVCDFISAFISVGVSLLITNNGSLYYHTFSNTVFCFSVFSITAIIFMYLFKIYNILWEYSNSSAVIRIFAATFVSTFVMYISHFSVFQKKLSVSFLFIIYFLTNSFLIFTRLVFKKHFIHSKQLTKNTDDESARLKGNVLLFGAGNAGLSVISEMSRKREFADCKIKCVIDDDVNKQGQYISGIKIEGGRNAIPEMVLKHNIDIIIFAAVNCSQKDKSDILNICQNTGCILRVIPSIFKMYNIEELSSVIRKVEIEDLLGRDPIDINMGDDINYVKDKIILVTGGGGSIGSELCRQIAINEPKKLIILDIYENNAYDILNELKANFPKLDVLALVGSVRDSKRLDHIFSRYKPQIIYHAAAHKHVPLMEDSPNESIKNNVFGTLKTAQCADRYGAEKFVLISTDKAVNPTNIMGASKRICEMIVQTFNNHSKTDYVAVRFGNVLGSNGSVIPLFKKQIQKGGPVTVTDPNIIRYFMTIPEAVSLVMRAGANAKGGEIFVLDMGQPVRTLDLAEKLIRLSGLTPYKVIDIEFTGLRPGEKLYEELLMSEEGLLKTDNSLIYIGKPIEFDEEIFKQTIEEMKATMYSEEQDIKLLVKRLVPTYVTDSKA